MEALVCFLQGMKILCFDVELGHERYICVEDLRPGILVVTYKHGYVPVDSIGYRKIYNPCVSENSMRMKNRLYVCNKSGFDEAEMSRFSYTVSEQKCIQLIARNHLFLCTVVKSLYSQVSVRVK